MDKELYRSNWENHLKDFRKLLLDLPEEKKEEFEEWYAEARTLIAFASEEVSKND